MAANFGSATLKNSFHSFYATQNKRCTKKSLHNIYQAIKQYEITSLDVSFSLIS